LQPYKTLVGDVASFVTIAQFFSGAFVCRDIYKKGSTRGFSTMPYTGGIALSVLMLKYGLILNDAAMIKVNVAGILLNVIYAVFFYTYAVDKYEEVLKPTAFAAGIVAVLLGYVEIESSENIEQRFGLILTLLMLAFLGSPLLSVKDIIAQKDASMIPFPIILMATIVTFLWLLYGVILQNYFMIVQNLIAYILCVVQLILIFMYPGGGGGEQSKKKKVVKKEQ